MFGYCGAVPCTDDGQCRGRNNRCMSYKCHENPRETCSTNTDCSGVCNTAAGTCNWNSRVACTQDSECGLCVTGTTVYDRLSKCNAPSTGTRGNAKGCKTHATFYQKTLEQGKCYCNQGSAWGDPNPASSRHSEIEAIQEAINVDRITEIIIWNDMIPCTGCAGAILGLLNDHTDVTSLTVMFGRFKDNDEVTIKKLNKYCYLESLCGLTPETSRLAALGGGCMDGVFVSS